LEVVILNRIALLLLVGILCTLPCLGQKKRKTPASRQTVTELVAIVDEHMPEAWQPFKSPEGRFSVLFPGRPKIVTQEQSTGEGKMVSHRFQLASPHAVYEVSFVEFPFKVDAPEKAKGMLDAVREDVLASDKGELLSEAEMVIEGHAGRGMIWIAENGSRYQAKYFLSNNRIYSLLFGVKEIENAPAEMLEFRQSIAGKFFDSFKMMPATRP
jgi:hypothetical protein